MKLPRVWREHTARIVAHRRATETQERLSKAIDFQIREANEVNAQARERLERNHLTELFESIIGGGRADHA